MKLFGLSKKRTSTLMLVVASVVVLYVYASLSPLNLYSYAKSVPIQIGYDEAKEHWVLGAAISEKTNFKFVLPEGETEAVDEDEEAKTESEVGVLFIPKRPYSKTNLAVTEYKYIARWGLLGAGKVSTKTPSYDVNDAGWLTTAVYSLNVYKNGESLKSQTFIVNYQEQRVVYLETSEGKITVNNLGILPQGVEVPSGDLVVVYDPDNEPHIWSKGDFVRMLEKWDNKMQWELTDPFKIWEWHHVWNWAGDEGYLPQDVFLTHIDAVTISRDKESITLTYGDIVFAGFVSVFVPAEMADTIIVQLFAPKPVITNVKPDPLVLDEGKKKTIEVTVRNDGTEGTISVSVHLGIVTATPVGPSTKEMEAGETYTFKFEMLGLNVEGDTTEDTKVFAQGRGGTNTYMLETTVKDVPDYTPPPPYPGPDGDGGEFPWLILLLIVAAIIIVWLIFRKKGSQIVVIK